METTEANEHLKVKWFAWPNTLMKEIEWFLEIRMHRQNTIVIEAWRTEHFQHQHLIIFTLPVGFLIIKQNTISSTMSI